MLRNLKLYYRPTTVDEAVTLVQTNAQSAYLGGGAWTVAQGAPQLETVVDLQGLGLDEIEGTLEEVRLGAMVRLQQLIDHPDSGALADGVLATAARLTQSRNLREQGTVGGTVIVAGPADPLTTALLALEAEVRYADPAIHTAPFTSFVAYRDRLVRTRALLTEVRIKRPPARSAAAIEWVGRSPMDRPIVCAVAYLAVDEGLPAVVRLAVGGAHRAALPGKADVDAYMKDQPSSQLTSRRESPPAPRSGEAQAGLPVRLHKSEHILRGQLLSAEVVERALDPALAELSPPDDYRGSADYRLAMAKVLAHRAVLSAWQRARR